MVDLRYGPKGAHLGMSDQSWIVHKRHRVSSYTVNQAHDLVAGSVLKCFFPDRFDLSGIASDARRRASVITETRVGEHLFHAEVEYQPIPILTAGAPKNKVQRAIFRLITIVGRGGVVVEVESISVVGIAQRVPHDPSQMQERAELADRHPLTLTRSQPMK